MPLRHKRTINRLSNLFKPNSATNGTVPPLPQIPPGDIPKARSPNQRVTSEELRDLRELIRHRYALDVEIWNLRDAQRHDRNIIHDKIRKSKAALAKIIRVVESLDDRSYFSSDAEHAKLQQIKSRVMEEGKRDWEMHPPWQDADVPMPMYEYTNADGGVTRIMPFEMD